MGEGGYERRENEIIKSTLQLAFHVREGLWIVWGRGTTATDGSPSVLGAHHHCRWYVLLVVATHCCGGSSP
jgi:hypothetical protein